jgi:DNA-directed RNA polymerase sigma subunit (sigma70/sigma32)
MIETINKFNKVNNALTTRLGRPPVDEEIAKEMDIELEKVAEIRKIKQNPTSLSTPIGEEKDSKLQDVIADDWSQSQRSMQHQNISEISSKIFWILSRQREKGPFFKIWSR